MDQQTISFVGAGRVGSALSKALFNAGFKIDLIVSESERSCQILSYTCKAKWSTNPVFPDSTDVIIIAVPDQRIISVLNTLKCGTDTIVVHTGGSTGINVFPEHINRKGIFYPLQTFSNGRNVNFKNLPFLLESTDDKTLKTLKYLAESIGGIVHYVDSEHRRMLHVAAVFICNFTNHMLTQGQDVAEKAGFSIGLFEPLLNETISKALEFGPESSQTGPASRNDINTIEKHLDLLSFSPELQRLYQEVTNSIIDFYKDKRHASASSAFKEKDKS